MKINRTVLLIVQLALLQGCAVPGMNIGTAEIQGKIIDQPFNGLNVRITLDTYSGVRNGLDDFFQNRMEFNKDEHKSQEHYLIKVKDDGTFERIDTLLYDCVHFFIPILGGFPSYTPKPYFYLKFSNKRDEIYVVGEAKGGFDYRVVNISTRTKITKEAAFWKIKSGKFTRIKHEGRKGWRLNIEIE